MLKQAIKRFCFAVAPVTSAEIMAARVRANSHRLVREWGLGELNRRLLDVLGNRVLSGPFRGMRLTPMTHAEHLGPILLGTYEAEIHPWLERAKKNLYTQILDVGAKFGYYAVGLANVHRNISTISFDTDPWARKAVAEMAAANEVLVEIEGYCSPAWLRANLKERAFIFSDCEGFERELFCSESIPALRSAEMLIETHEQDAPGVTAQIRERYGSTHTIESAHSVKRQRPAIEGLEKFSPEEIERAIDEIRPEQEWLYLTPKNVVR